MDKKTVNLNIFLLKETYVEFEDCLKSPRTLHSSELNQSFELDGKIYYSNSKTNSPKWKSYLQELAKEDIEISDNTSNKAIMLVRIENRIMALVFGYGRTFLKEECIVRNFGFKVALNTIDQNKMRSVSAATIEDMVVTTQRQASYSTSQDEFGLNISNDIMKGITGVPFEEKYGNHISGKDSLIVSLYIDMSELKDKLVSYLCAYNSTRYKNIGFEWVDNVAEIRDSILCEALDCELIQAIKSKNIEHLHIAPPETTDWDKIIGFCYSGIKKKTEDSSNYNLNLDITEYIDKINPDSNIDQKIRRDRLLAMNSDEVPFTVCSIYSALVFQTKYNNYDYILCSGTWYQVEKNFFEMVNNYIETRIKISDISLPDCPCDMHEGEYNEKITSKSNDFCLMDKKLASVLGGPKQIEPCDIFTKDKKFIHVKNKGQSSQLSHLFAQGKISAECFSIDECFRKNVYDIAKEKFGTNVFDYKQKPESNEYEVVYAIIDDKVSTLKNKLPFFSKVNLMLTSQELERMHFKCSVCLVKKEKC